MPDRPEDSSQRTSSSGDKGFIGSSYIDPGLIAKIGETVSVSQQNTGYSITDNVHDIPAVFDTVDTSWEAVSPPGTTLTLDDAMDGILLHRPCILLVQFYMYLDDNPSTYKFTQHLFWEEHYSEFASWSADASGGYIGDQRLVLAAPPADAEYPIKLQVRGYGENVGPRDAWMALTACVLSGGDES